MKKKLLFLCTHNSARSQMAEALVNHFYNKNHQAFSAGTEPGKVNPYSIKVLKELGIDISNARSKNATEFVGEEFDIVITVCDNAKENCPIFPWTKKIIHKGFSDPSSIKGTDQEKLNAFRKIRDEIKKWLEQDLFL